VLRICYDPFRSSKIALVLYDNGLLGFILAVTGLDKSSVIFSGDSLHLARTCYLNYNVTNVHDIMFNIGNAYPLSIMPVGLVINSIELYPDHGCQLVRAAGTAALYYKKSDTHAYIKMPSG